MYRYAPEASHTSRASFIRENTTAHPAENAMLVTAPITAACLSWVFVWAVLTGPSGSPPPPPTGRARLIAVARTFARTAAAFGFSSARFDIRIARRGSGARRRRCEAVLLPLSNHRAPHAEVGRERKPACGARTAGYPQLEPLSSDEKLYGTRLLPAKPRPHFTRWAPFFQDGALL